MKTCFSIMPFGDDFRHIDRIIRHAAERCRLQYIRGDLTDQPGSVLPQILHEIRRAAVVVADITGHNPNVFYELGIAHQVKLSDRLCARFRRLVGLLAGRSDVRGNAKAAADDLKAMKQCEFVLSPVPMPNVMIIGKLVAYEGMKRAGTGGVEMTHCETSADGLQELIDQFDRFFEESRQAMICSHPPDGRLAEQLRQYCIEAGCGCDRP
jgi:hypothetical protein